MSRTTKNQPAEPQVTEKKASLPKIEGLPKLGDTVIYYKQEPTGGAPKMVEYAAQVCGYPPPASNFKPEDQAVDLWILPRKGGESATHRQGVMKTRADQKNGRWDYRD